MKYVLMPLFKHTYVSMSSLNYVAWNWQRANLKKSPQNWKMFFNIRKSMVTGAGICLWLHLQDSFTNLNNAQNVIKINFINLK